MSAAELTAIAGTIAALTAFIGLVAAAIYRFGKLTEATHRIPNEIRTEIRHNYDRIESHEKLTEQRFLRHEELVEERFRRHEELIRHVEELVRIEAERTREQIRNLHQAIMSHSHDEDGSVMLRVPPPESDQQ